MVVSALGFASLTLPIASVYQDKKKNQLSSEGEENLLMQEERTPANRVGAQ